MILQSCNTKICKFLNRNNEIQVSNYSFKATMFYGGVVVNVLVPGQVSHVQIFSKFAFIVCKQHKPIEN